MHATILLASLVLAVAALPARATPESWKREGWANTDFSRTTIEWSEILSGGPPKDGIPAIDKPAFAPVSEATDLAPVDPVIAIDIAGDARAYPLRILIWHEIANDTVGGKPVAVTYCPLCNSSIVFERTVDGQVLDFGTTGKLRNSDLVMYDRQTESWWQQFTGEAIVGQMTGQTLALVPARLESFADFRARHPAGKILRPPTGSGRAYGRNPYVGYDTSSSPFLYRGDLPEGIEPLARVVVVKTDRKAPLVITLNHIRKSTPLDIGNVRLTWKPGQASAVDSSEIAKGRDVGTVEARALASGEPGELLPADMTFAFAAHAFHPKSEIIGR